ncbi:MAG: DUF2757 family protein [Hydrogenibacillus schlegelii]|nr:DUF2757 family protein [Hydrogenibacillus schlegelii]
MALVYQCRICRSVLGVFYHDEPRLLLTLERLAPEDRAALVEETGEATRVWVVCEHCQSAYDAHPELYELDSPLQ